MDRYQVLEDLKAWLHAEDEKIRGHRYGTDRDYDKHVSTAMSRVLDKIEELEYEHE